MKEAREEMVGVARVDAAIVIHDLVDVRAPDLVDFVAIEGHGSRGWGRASCADIGRVNIAALVMTKN